MNQEKRLKDFIPEVTMEGKQISFSQFMDDMVGSGEIYDAEYTKILGAAIEADENDWAEVSDAIAPIVREILTETVQESPEIYRDLMLYIQYSHLRMMNKFYSKKLEDIGIKVTQMK